jgi:hypothetical protein
MPLCFQKKKGGGTLVTHTLRGHGEATSTTITCKLPPTRDLRLHSPMVTILGQLREADHHPPTLDGCASRLESVRMEAAQQLSVVIHLSPPNLTYIAQPEDGIRWTSMSDSARSHRCSTPWC